MNGGDFTWLDAALVAIALALSTIMLQRGIRDAQLWRATVTPLASIIGSGFLVVAPLLLAVVGSAAGFTMLGIVILSLWLGSALRFNILHDGRHPIADAVSFTSSLEQLSDMVLAFAYTVSIAFYIRLMSSFVLHGVGLFTEFNADVFATLVLLGIGFYGMKRGLHGLERLEEYSVTIKLSIIAALLFGLGYYSTVHGYRWEAIPDSVHSHWERLRLLGGMLLIVQGFETSKYLDAEYPATVRVRSMLWAQLLAGAIYIVYVFLAMPLTAPLATLSPSETAIVDISAQIAFVLPVMIVIAAAMSQFSAAIADTLGAGGVVEKETSKRISSRVSYPIIAVFACALLWTTNIFEIIALASRAFAFYYLLQALLAMRLAAASTQRRNPMRLASFFLLALIMLAIVLFAKPLQA